jgi:hypothetical protein
MSYLNSSKRKINNLNRFIESNEIKAVVKCPQKKKSAGVDGLNAELYQTLKEEITHQCC